MPLTAFWGMTNSGIIVALQRMIHDVIKNLLLGSFRRNEWGQQRISGCEKKPRFPVA